MTTCMSEILCVTNRKLCKENFLERIEKIAKANSTGIILREKDLNKREYKILAERVLKICSAFDTKCIIHSFPDIAKDFDCRNLHMPLHLLSNMTKADRQYFNELGASCHSVEDAVQAEKLGCSYIIAGHIFNTDCKKGFPGRGLDFLKSICDSVSIPVYAIGGIDSKNITEVLSTGAKGTCVMSGLMLCDNPHNYLHNLME